jgi:DNA repair photolyase
MMAPLIPGLTDHEMPAILSAAAAAGATFASYVPIRLPGAVASLFQDWLDRHYPGSKDKILGRIRAMKDGQLNKSEFGERFKASGIWGEQFKTMFELSRRKAGMGEKSPKLSVAAFSRPKAVDRQMRLF